MFNSTILDVAVGLSFAFLAISLAVSALTEAVASMMNWRSQTLLQGVKDLLNDQDFNGLARDIYNHALVNPRDTGTAQTAAELKFAPAYIDPQHFAEALLQTTAIAGETPALLKTAIAACVHNSQLQQMLNGMVDRTAGDAGKLRQEVARWFDNAMDRVSGAYKRKTQVWNFGFALGLALVLNVDAIGLGEALWRQPMITRSIGPSAAAALNATLAQVNALGLPLGWTAGKLTALSISGLVTSLLGCFITAVATLFGAPFWFDLLQQIIRLKGTGPSPAEKAAGSGAAA
jgi:hypothetical protein